MPQLIFIAKKQQKKYEVDAPSGASLMEVAVFHQIPGIAAECGGGCACATCHVFFNAEDFKKIPPLQPMEHMMLNFAENVTPYSRLACQVEVQDSFHQIQIYIPED